MFKVVPTWLWPSNCDTALILAPDSIDSVAKVCLKWGAPHFRHTIATLKNALPKLELSFSNNEKPTNNKNFTLSSRALCDKKDFEKEIESLKRKYPKINKNEGKKSALREGSQNLFGGLLNVVSDEEIKRYNSDVDNYIERYKNYLKSCRDITAAYERSIRFIIEVWNIGKRTIAPTSTTFRPHGIL